MMENLESLLGHPIDLAQDFGPVLGPERNVENIGPEFGLEFGLELLGIGIVLVRSGGDETADPVAGNGPKSCARSIG
jgi:hypothetical protein